MSVATQALKYGWKALAILTVGGATIFTADTTMRRITTETVIQIVLGIHERCLATQYSTNPVSYYVTPPEVVRSMVSTNGAGGWETNSVTNTIDWRMDRAMMVDLDAKIFALIPYYADPDTVYDGTTNISMLTVTGLFASLQIGDHTNQFTAIPAIGTNAATFGPWAWRNYVVAWQERYKVLNALKKLKISYNSISNVHSTWPRIYLTNTTWNGAMADADNNIANLTTNTTWTTWPYDGDSYTYGGQRSGRFAAVKGVFSKMNISWINYSEFNGSLEFYACLTNLSSSFDASHYYPGELGWWTPFTVSNAVYAANGTPNVNPGVYYRWINTTVGSNAIASSEYSVSGDASWCDAPTDGDNGGTGKGFRNLYYQSLFTPQFNYCTVKYW
jgi:hypothetical protein